MRIVMYTAPFLVMIAAWVDLGIRTAQLDTSRRRMHDTYFEKLRCAGVVSRARSSLQHTNPAKYASLRENAKKASNDADRALNIHVADARTFSRQYYIDATVFLVAVVGLIYTHLRTLRAASVNHDATNSERTEAS